MSYEEIIYEKMCKNCPNAKKCHDDCVTCQEYDEAVHPEDYIEWVEVRPHEFVAKCELVGGSTFNVKAGRSRTANLVGDSK